MIARRGPANIAGLLQVEACLVKEDHLVKRLSLCMQILHKLLASSNGFWTVVSVVLDNGPLECDVKSLTKTCLHAGD